MDTQKKCSKCKEAKPLAEFSKNKRSKDGHQNQCKGCVNRYNKENRVAIAEQTKCYREGNRVTLVEKAKRYYEKNRGTLVEKAMRYRKERRATDPLFRLTDNIRALIGNSFRNGGFNKKSKTAEIIGCSFDEFHQHIESQFTDGMSWDLMGDIHIDHRLPLSAANTEEEILVLNHHRNLQPMWATDNLAKSDSYCPDELAAYFKKHLPT